jgi:hypothetical protein
MTKAGNYNNSIAITELGIRLFRNVCRKVNRVENTPQDALPIADKIVILEANAS